MPTVTAFPGTVTVETGGSGWSDINNVQSADGNDAVFDLPDGSPGRLRCTNFGFSIPSGASIDLIEVRSKFVANDYSVSFNLVENNTSRTDTAGAGASEAWVQGGFTGGSWYSPPEIKTPTDINDSGWGVTMDLDSIRPPNPATIDYMEMRITYTEASGDPVVGPFPTFFRPA